MTRPGPRFAFRRALPFLVALSIVTAMPCAATVIASGDRIPASWPTQAYATIILGPAARIALDDQNNVAYLTGSGVYTWSPQYPTPQETISNLTVSGSTPSQDPYLGEGYLSGGGPSFGGASGLIGVNALGTLYTGAEEVAWGESGLYAWGFSGTLDSSGLFTSIGASWQSEPVFSPSQLPLVIGLNDNYYFGNTYPPFIGAVGSTNPTYPNVSLLVGINDNGDAIAAGSSIDPNTGRYPYGFYSASTGSFSQRL